MFGCGWLALAGTAYAANHPLLHPNSEHYRNTGSAPATGRSGSASLQVRALTGRSGITDVELTTGTFESGPAAPGSLRQVQLKTYDASGALRATRHEADVSSSGAADLQFTDLARGEPIQVQANVTGIDGARTDVVSVSTTVKLRPDLAVDAVSVPSSTLVGTMVNVSALLVERNGDVGANADCVLSVDGSEVDRATGIWVDAGGSVSCAFVHLFTEAGPHTLSVTAANVAPLDDDPSNNTGTATLTVLPPSSFQYAASIRSEAYDNVSYSSSTYQSDDGTTTQGSDSSTTTESTGHSQQAGFVGQLGAALRFPIRVSITESSDGALQTQLSLAEIAGDWSIPQGSGVKTCASRFDSSTAGFVFICSVADASAPRTSLSYSRFAGDATYFSTQFTRYWWRDDATGVTTEDSWTSNSSSSTTQGTELQVGSDYVIAADLGGADGAAFSATADIHTAPFTQTSGHPVSCTDYASGASLSRSCWGWSQSETGVSGEARSVP